MNIYFSENVKRMRKEKDLTQETLAEALGVSFQTISKWERGESYPDLSMLSVISSFFSVSVDVLLGIDKAHTEETIKSFEDGILIGEIVNVSADESVLTDGQLDIRKLKPISFNPFDNKYYGVGEEEGHAFKDGLTLRER